MKQTLSILMLSLLLISIAAQPTTCDPNSCYGECRSGTCQCFPGFLGANCDIPANLLVEGEFSQETVDNNEWVFFYHEIDGTKSEMQLNWKASTGRVRLTALLQSEDKFETPDNRNSFDEEFTAEDAVQTINFMLTGNSIGRKSRFVLGVTNANPSDPTPIIVGVQLNFDDTMIGNFTTLSITIAVAILTMIVLSCVMCCVYRKRRMNEIIQRQHAAMIQMQAMMVQEMERENQLTKEDINKYFPQKKFGELKSSYSQTICAVCLDEFNPESVCHQLYCEHIFHVPCIEAWLLKHNSCPDCRKAITKKAIQEFLKAEKNAKKESADDVRIPFDENPTGNTERIDVVIPARVEIPRPINQENQESSEEQASLIDNPVTSIRHGENLENKNQNDNQNNDQQNNHNVLTIEI